MGSCSRASLFKERIPTGNRGKRAGARITSQRAAEAFTVSPFASDAPNDSQRSLWCKPDSGVPLSALKVLPTKTW